MALKRVREFRFNGTHSIPIAVKFKGRPIAKPLCMSDAEDKIKNILFHQGRRIKVFLG